MKLTSVVAILTSVWFASSALANENRLYPLLVSRLFSNFEDGGEWTVSASDSELRYECINCSHRVTAKIEIIAPYGAENYTSYRDRYLTERASFCAKIVREFRGRCIATDEADWNLSLVGFRSAHEINDQLVTEIVLFYRNRYFGSVRGPELIKGTIKSSKGTTVPKGTAEMLRWHMARLTTLY